MNMEDDDSVSSGSNNNRNIRPRLILELIDRLSINAKKFTRFNEIKIKDLQEDGAVANRKGYLDLQLL